MTVIALDAMGGDFAPRIPVAAAVRAVQHSDCTVILVGDRALIQAELEGRRYPAERLRIEHTPDFVSMDEPPTVLLRQKPRASVRVGFELVRDGVAQALISAGHSGATMVAGKLVLEALPGVERPAIASLLPRRHGASVLVDSGANVDCKPQYLAQFAQMGEHYARMVLGIERPRVALLSNGSEAGKGNDLVRQTHERLAVMPGLNYVGNIEGGSLFRSRADVVVCDGFVGNVALKTAEGAASQLRLLLAERGPRAPWVRLGLWLARGFLVELARRSDYREVGGSLLLGLRGIAVVCHGGSNAHTLENAIREAIACDRRGLVKALAQGFLPPADGAAVADNAVPPAGTSKQE